MARLRSIAATRLLDATWPRGAPFPPLVPWIGAAVRRRQLVTVFRRVGTIVVQTESSGIIESVYGWNSNDWQGPGVDPDTDTDDDPEDNGDLDGQGDDPDPDAGDGDDGGGGDSGEGGDTGGGDTGGGDTGGGDTGSGPWGGDPPPKGGTEMDWLRWAGRQALRDADDAPGGDSGDDTGANDSGDPPPYNPDPDSN